jgi:long-subunit fatty acid transport protein
MRQISLITLLACLTIVASSQSLIPIKYGIKVGLNSSSISTSSIEGVKPTVNASQIGISAGACVYIPLSDKWLINAEVLYSQKGASFDYEFTHDYEVNQRDTFNTTNQLTLSYIELNPTINFKATDKLTLNFGPSVSFLIGEKYIHTPETFPFNTNDLLITDGLIEAATLDVGLNVGLSYFITENFVVDTRVYTGFMKAAEVTQPYKTVVVPNPEYKLKNRAIVFSLAYLF